ncbi:alpha-amylase family glycosyl hydrolase [Reichenbachiella ulvae]|uniref:Alpha-amylase family glycosyl hydrolase n=1 Tax=Reichenbachiella ulvae TaxID=2980104 RepID=A0ABT3CSH8_9BACT|nr:alpha-amylase family glycosyl hydrolase [Reichenbachiella ulvae]MCV9386536.1 alpha-amylase family glycosyl hydrolase [Reichenbachiella ulvae]
MKKISYLVIVIMLSLAACQQKHDSTIESPTTTSAITFPERAAHMAVYEVNIRQATPEGTIQAFIQHLPRLQKLGIEMLWIMPVQPISKVNRKGTLGSYYSIADYTAVNPEFGSLLDFKKLVEEAHQFGMVVLLDWVPNHTGWDHPWITDHPEYYAKDSLGNITYEADWSDIALLDHTQDGTRSAMIEEMAFWIKECDIDGFRCDHAAHEIPLYFWEEATDALNPMKDLFWLAEWDEPRLHTTFHASYSWELLHLTEDVAKGHKNANDIATFIQKDQALYGRRPFRMTITTNHDENSWAGTVFERYGEGHQAFATFIFTAYGFPMIYNGQEVGLNKRLEFFEKDSIDWSDPLNLSPFYKQLLSLKKENKALWNGDFGGSPKRINKDEDIYAFVRKKEGNQVIGIINMSDQKAQLNLTDSSIYGQYSDYFTGETFELSGEPLELTPWQYLIFTN